MRQELTAEEYWKVIQDEYETWTLQPEHVKTYGDLRAKEAVEKFVDDLVALNNLLSRDQKNISEESKVFLNTLIEKYVSTISVNQTTRS